MFATLSVAAVTAPSVAGAATNPVAASWSSGPSCGSYATATPPAGTVSATVTVKGAGGGGGATNSGSGGTGGTGDGLTGTLLLTHATGPVAVDLGCGGGGGTQNGGSGTTNGGAGGGGYAAGAAGGPAKAETASVDGRSSGGGGGGASGLCLGTTGCTQELAVVGGGGGGGARWDCTGSTGPGAGGSGSTGSTPPAIDPGTAGTNGDGSNGTGGGGGTSTGGGTGGAGYEQNGNGGGNTPTSSAGGSGGTGGSTSAFSYEAGAGGGGGGGGYTGGGGGGGDSCASGSDASGGGGAGSSQVNATYNLSTTYTGGGSGGGTSTAGTAGSISLTWNVDNLSVTNPGSHSSVSGSSIPTLTISAPHDTTGGNGVTFSATGLPTGLSINPSTGAITGTPTTAGTSSVTVTATDSQALSASASFSWTVTNTVTVSGHGAQSNGSGTPISSLPDSAGDSSPTATIASWSSSGLPPGLAISPTTGAITGTPTTAGSYSVTVTATDSAGFAGSTTFAWTVTNTVTVASPGSQSSLSGAAISSLATNASDSSSTASITHYGATGLPAGLSINSTTGAITGTPTTAGSHPATVTATDSAGFSGSVTFTWTVSNTVSITDPGDQSDVSGSAIAPVVASGTDTSSTTSLSYAATGLPAGLTDDPTTGTISGTPTTAGTTSVTVTATDGVGYSAQTTFSWTVSNQVSVAAVGDQASVSGSPITPLAVDASDTSSTATLSYSATGLPAGLSIDVTTGSITGSPTIAGTYHVTVTAADDAGFSAQGSFNWVVTNTVTMTNPGDQSSVSGSTLTPLGIPTVDSLPGAVITFSDGGTLPPGLVIDPSSGTISGNPTTAGTYAVTVTATDDSDFSAEVSFNWTVTNVVTVTDPGDVSGVSGSAVPAFSVVASDSSPTASISFGATGLPSGTSIDPTSGLISGTPVTSGIYPVTVTVTDSAGFTGTTSFTWTVTNGVAVTNPGSVTSVSGSPVSPLPVVATDTSTTATISFSAGSTLPPGLTIAPSTGIVSGTPTTGGSFAVTVTATDSSGFAGTTSFTWTVTNSVSVHGPANQTNGVGSVIIPVTETASDTSSTATLTWSATGLPTGLTIAPTTGTISGTISHSGVYPVSVTATDGAGFHGSAGFTWTAVGPAITSISPAGAPGAGGTKVQIVGSDFTGVSSVTFGSLPATSFTVNKSGKKITAFAPSEPAGTVMVTVTTPQGPTLSSPVDLFTYAGPVITKLSKTAGQTAGGLKVVISGSGFQGASSVRFGTVPATSYTVNKGGTKITAFSPALPVGTVDVTVTTPGGTSPTSSADQFTAS